jgi:hypothetical protein
MRYRRSNIAGSVLYTIADMTVAATESDKLHRLFSRVQRDFRPSGMQLQLVVRLTHKFCSPREPNHVHKPRLLSRKSE